MFLARLPARQAFPDLRYTIDDLVVEGDHAAVCWTAQGTQTGEYGAAAATGKPVTWTGMSFFALKDGKIAGEETNLESPSEVLSAARLAHQPQLYAVGIGPFRAVSGRGAAGSTDFMLPAAPRRTQRMPASVGSRQHRRIKQAPHSKVAPLEIEWR